jgi:hypothetical protein
MSHRGREREGGLFKKFGKCHKLFEWPLIKILMLKKLTTSCSSLFGFGGVIAKD